MVTSDSCSVARLNLCSFSQVVRDRASVTFAGPSATPQQLTNASLASYLFQCWSRLSKLEDEHTDAVVKIISPSVEVKSSSHPTRTLTNDDLLCQSLHAAYERLVDPILTAIRRELGAIIARLHRIDFGKSVDPMAGMGGPSFYMKDLVEKLSYIKTEILSNYKVGEDGRAW